MATNRVTRRRRGNPQISDFGLIVYDPESCSGPFTMMMEGPWVESWGAEACQEVARLLGMTERKTKVTNLELAAGIHIEIPTPAEPVPLRVFAVSVRTDESLPVGSRDDGASSAAIPTFEVENLVRLLMGAAKSVSNGGETQEVKVGV